MILYNDEPLEVCILKKQLANLTCKCSVCDKPQFSGSCKQESKASTKESFTRNVLNPHDQNFQHNTSFTGNFDALCNTVSCPGCYIALNLLKSRETKVWKDEETETNLGISCCDKSNGRNVKFVERTTSTSSINPSKNSCTSLCEKVTNTALSGIMKKRSNEHVTFSDYLARDELHQNVEAFYGHCFCLENFIDSIRPPVTNP